MKTVVPRVPSNRVAVAAEDRMSPTTGAWARYLLPLPLVLSGFCGIAYEVLYARLLGNLLGDQFTVNASVLLTFLLGIGFGTLYAHRFRRWLWAIEIGIGAYAALFALGYDAIDALAYRALPLLGANAGATALTAIALLLTPALLIGCSIPLFASYFVLLRETRAFSSTYAIYNVGAGATALAMEFALLRLVGLRDATLVLAALNTLVAAGVWVATRSMPDPPVLPVTERVRFPPRLLAALAAASVASAIFQLALVKLATFVLGPYNDTFALVLANVLFGISLGSFAAGRFGWTLERALVVACAGLLALLLLFPAIVTGYSMAYRSAAESYATLVALKFLLVSLLMLLPAIGFGATIPALLPAHRQIARESGQLLFVSSMGNVLGFVLMAFVLHRALDYGPLLVLVAALAAAAALLARPRPTRAALVASTLAALCLVALRSGWNEGLLYLGYTEFQSVKKLQAARDSRTAEQRFKGPQDVFAIVRRSGRPYFFINGYISIPLSSPEEKIIGAVAAMLAPRVDRALVLGLGTGATAGTVGLLFDRTDVVEINRVVIDHQQLMADYSFDIGNQPNVRLVHDDGIHFLKASPERYSLILNTVTTPLYFSSSKLYTRDFFEIVKRRLTPDGVYLTWVDGRVGDRGIDIILGTLERSFASCVLAYMNSTYFHLVCSDETVALRQYEAVEANQRLREFFRERHAMPLRLFPYAVLARDAFRFRGPGPPAVNTLDRPLLEFAMARLREDGIPRFGTRLSARWELADARGASAGWPAWDPAEFGLFAELKLPSDSALLGLIRGKLADATADLDRAALAAAREVGDATAHEKYGRILFDRGRYDAAIEALERALELDPRRDNAHYRLARSCQAAGDLARAYEHLLAEWDLDRDDDVPLLAATVLIDAGRPAAALPWLDAAEALQSERNPARIAYYRGLAHEGLDDAAEALQHYHAALADDDSLREAHQALARIDGRPDS